MTEKVIIRSPIDPYEQDQLWKGYTQNLSDEDYARFDVIWDAYSKIYSRRREEGGPPQAWQPDQESMERSNLGQFMKTNGFDSYQDLHRWSAENRAIYFSKAIECLKIVFSTPPEEILDSSDGVKNPNWLPGAEFNCVDSCFLADADKVAIISGKENFSHQRVTTYGQLERLVNRVASGLREQGFEAGDAIALYMPMNLECVAAYLGIVRSGCRVVSIADSFSPVELAKRFELGKAKSIITSESYLRGGRPVDLFAKVKEAEISRAIVIPSENSQDLDLREGDIFWDNFLSSKDTFSSQMADAYSMTNILFSSGTTGTPKVIPWNQLTPIKCAADGHFHLDILPEDVVVWPTNIGWMMGPWLIYAALMNRATLALYEGIPTGEGFIHFLQEAGVTVLGVVPSLVHAWRSANNRIDLNGVRVFSSTGEPSSSEDYLWLMSCAKFKAPVIEYCGGTEIGGSYITGTVVQPASPATFTTPSLGIDFVILDEKGRSVEKGQMGEVFLIPPSLGLSQTLLNKDHEKVYYEGCPPGPRGEILRRHGDQMAKLHKGYFKAQGRADDTMNLGGIKVSSLELEDVLNTHPDIYESAAIAYQPLGEGADSLVVFAVTRTATEKDKLIKELSTKIKKELNPLFKIHDLEFSDHLPRTASNKLMRRTLRDQYLKMKNSNSGKNT
ncbi:AMP-binding protein [Acidobacteriota bacterium]